MVNQTKINFLKEIKKKYGAFKKLPKSLSLFDIGEDTRIYVRYSKIHKRNQTFFGLRKDDLLQLEGRNSLLVFIWDSQVEPVFIPYSEFEDVFQSLTPAADGQFKVQIFLQEDAMELYIPNNGRFNIESFYGWEILDRKIDSRKLIQIPDFSHYQIQSFLGAIGSNKGYDIWIPPSDRKRLDLELASKYDFRHELPGSYNDVMNIINEIDVIWLNRGASEIKALFEVEHSTPIYSGLLRFNDIHLIKSDLRPRYSIVSNESRRTLFLKQINRPTFKMSGLVDYCNFLEYRDVYSWFNRIYKS